MKMKTISEKLNKISEQSLKSLLQMSYSLVVILELNSGSEVQYKEIMMIGDE